MFEFILQADAVNVYSNIFLSILTTVGIAVPLIVGVIRKVDKDGKNKIADALEQHVMPIQESLVKNAATIKEGMQVAYDMSPEEAQKIVNKPLVKLSELNKEIDRQNENLQKLKSVIDRYGQ